MEINREDIIKALECCGSEVMTRLNCQVCPIGGKRDCMTYLYRQALTLIKSQEQKIFELENRLKECENGYEQTLHLERARIKNLTEENEKLIINMNAFGLTAKRLAEQHKNTAEQLSKACYMLDALDNDMANALIECARDTKNETVDKMAEMIKERLIKWGIFPAIVKNTINKVAKELKEE